MKSILFCLSLLLLSFNSLAKDKIVTFSYWSEAGPPFVFLNEENQNSIGSGLVKDLANLISTKLKATPHFVNIPVKRTEEQLLSGLIDLNCITNPIWKTKPDQYHWSPALFSGADRFLITSEKKNSLNTLSDLKGKSLGVYKGYTYHPTIMKMINEGDIKAIKITGVDHGIKLLQLNRIDALIDFDIILNYKIKSEKTESLKLANLTAQTYDLFCAYSKKSEFDKAQLDALFESLLKHGEIANLLNRYIKAP